MSNGWVGVVLFSFGVVGGGVLGVGVGWWWWVCVCVGVCVWRGGGGLWFKGLRPVLEGFVVPMHQGVCETGSQITIITWHFQICPVSVSIIPLKYEYRAQSKSRFACYSHCYVTWCLLTTGIVAQNSRRHGTLHSWRATSSLSYRRV